MQQTLRQIALTIAAGSAVAGCATIVKGSSQSVAITTPPITGANCQLMSGQGTWNVMTPGIVTVERSKEDILVRCDKLGFQEATAVIPSNFEGWTVGNLLLGGVVGIGVDAATGAINQYPNAFQVPMTPIVSIPAAQGERGSAISGNVAEMPVAAPLCTEQEEAQEQALANSAVQHGFQFRGRCFTVTQPR